jgi:restriction system protein
MARRHRTSRLWPVLWLAVIFAAYLVMRPAGSDGALAVLQSLLLWGLILVAIGAGVRLLMRMFGPEPRIEGGADLSRHPSEPPILRIAPADEGGAAPRVRPPLNVWSGALLQQLEWKRFEALCGGFWNAKGYPVRTTGAGPDGGVNLVIEDRQDSTRMFAVMQCRAATAHPVSVDAVRALWGVRNHFGATLAIYYSVSGFTEDALHFAEGKHLKLVDAAQLLEQLRQLEPAQGGALLHDATQGDYHTPSCPVCGIKMQRRAGRAGGPEIWGCRNERRCGARPIASGL